MWSAGAKTRLKRQILQYVWVQNKDGREVRFQVTCEIVSIGYRVMLETSVHILTLQYTLRNHHPLMT